MLNFSVATLFRFVTRFVRGTIEDPSLNRIALNCIPELPATSFFLHNSKNKNKLGNGVQMSAPKRHGAQLSSAKSVTPIWPSPHKYIWARSTVLHSVDTNFRKIQHKFSKNTPISNVDKYLQVQRNVFYVYTKNHRHISNSLFSKVKKKSVKNSVSTKNVWDFNIKILLTWPTYSIMQNYTAVIIFVFICKKKSAAILFFFLSSSEEFHNITLQ